MLWRRTRPATRRVSTGARGSVRVSFRLELDNGVFALTVKGNICVESDVKWSCTVTDSDSRLIMNTFDDVRANAGGRLLIRPSFK